MEMTLFNVEDIILTKEIGSHTDWIDVSVVTSEGHKVIMTCFHKKDNPINIKMKPTNNGDEHV